MRGSEVTIPGWYWRRDGSGIHRQWVVVEVMSSWDGLKVFSNDDSWPLHEDFGEHIEFEGPIDPPGVDGRRALQNCVNWLRATFPRHHLTLNIYPTGGTVGAQPCGECGSYDSGSSAWQTEGTLLPTTADDAVAALSKQLSG